MVSALASATDYVERNGIKPTGGKHIETLLDPSEQFIFYNHVFLGTRF